jgi:orotidine-5'-phosphate decarboxylase
MNDQCGLIINSARNIIYASAGENFASAARTAAMSLKDSMAKYLIAQPN